MKSDPIDLVLDIGNSRSKLALFQGATVLRAGILEHPDLLTVQRFIDRAPVRAIAVASVGDTGPELVAALAPYSRTVLLTGQSPSPLRISYDTPETLGVDRLANSVAAASMFPGRSVLVVDIGTCITYDLVTVQNGFEGGLISPGPYMRAQAMHAYSARLPLIDPVTDGPLIGRSTRASLSAGVFHGIRYEIEGVVHDLRQQASDLAVVLTGGGAPPSIAALKIGIFADPLLTLRGSHVLLLHQLNEARGASPAPSAGLAPGPRPGK